jgi:regulator of CtrA degradation
MQDTTRGMDMAASTNGNVNVATVSFTERMLASESFMTLFREGMGLVEATAAYLDGEGRTESRSLDRIVALAYASESMRLTTRLMQLTSWLLLQRAVNEGELSRTDAEREHRRVVVTMQDSSTAADVYEQLPASLRDLIMRSLSLHARIQRIDRELKGEVEVTSALNPVSAQLGQLAAAFGVK